MQRERFKTHRRLKKYILSISTNMCWTSQNPAGEEVLANHIKEGVGII
jgi:hypothetical protein